MLKTSCGQRDIGQCEVSRLIMGEPLYHSSFEYVKHSLELDNREINSAKSTKNNDWATKKSFFDKYASRYSDPALVPYLTQNMNFCDFAKQFSYIAGNLSIRSNPDAIVFITYPKVNYNPDNLTKYQEYCYYQL